MRRTGKIIVTIDCFCKCAVLLMLCNKHEIICTKTFYRYHLSLDCHKKYKRKGKKWSTYVVQPEISCSTDILFEVRMEMVDPSHISNDVNTDFSWTQGSHLAMEPSVMPPSAWPTRLLGAVSIRKTVFPGMAIPMLKIRRPSGRLIFNMEIAKRR